MSDDPKHVSEYLDAAYKKTADDNRAKFPEVAAFLDKLRGAFGPQVKVIHAKEGNHEAGKDDSENWQDEAPEVTRLLGGVSESRGTVGAGVRGGKGKGPAPRMASGKGRMAQIPGLSK